MSNKKQQSSKRNQPNEYTGGGIFSINKSRTSIWTKVVLIILAVAMVIGTSAGLVSVIIGAGNAASTNKNTGSVNETIESINSSYAAQVKTAQAEVDKDPENADLYAALGNTYFDWATQLQQAVSGLEDYSSIDTTSTSIAMTNAWTGAKDAYKKAIELNPDVDPGVVVDYSFVLYYSGETTASVEVAQGVAKDDPSFSMAWLSLGESYAALGETSKAIEAYEKFVEKAPADTSNTNATQNVDYAKSQIESLKSTDASK